MNAVARAFLLPALLVLLLLPSTSAGARTANEHEFFEDRIRPLLTRHCFKCHTDDELGELRLDSRSAILRGGTSGPAIVPGNPDASLLIAAVRHELPELKMPMGGKLSPQQIADLEEWVRRGAPWPGEASDAAPIDPAASLVTAEHRSFWSFQPLAAPQPPPVRDEAGVRTDVDRFVLARLAQEGLEPVGDASKRDLLRRVTYDLTGLPPTPEEIAAFLADEDYDAFSRVVDRLLASPHYGERWGRHWLDVARYGDDDTRGLAEDGSGRERYPSAHVYRDWVVRAFNQDLPFDLFVKAQLAADLLPLEGSDEEVVARRAELLPGLGLLGIGPWYYDVAEPAVARADERHDRVDVTTRGFLGLTVACARCHHHKYDPLPTHDYYALAGIFANTDYHEYPLGSEREVREQETRKEWLETLQKQLRAFTKAAGEQRARILARQTERYMMAAWQVTGEPEREVEEVVYAEKLDLEMLERWIDFLDDEPQHYPHLSEWQAMIADDGGTEERARELAQRFERQLLELVARREKIREQNEWLIANGSPPPDERKSTPMPNGFESFFDEHQLELETLEREELNLYYDVFEYDLDGTADYYDFDPGLFVFDGWGLERNLAPEAVAHIESLREEIETLRREIRETPFVMGVKDKEPDDIADLGLHLRGSPHNLGEPVPRRFLTVLGPPEGEPFTVGSGRLELAEAIAAHPLTARVIVNRVWRWHFGTGIVETPSNFGRMGERPSHPELLDYLASRFVDSGFSLKALHREILLSSAYRRSTEGRRRNLEVDPANRLYWRFDRRRLEAEELRDTLLMVAGRLDPELGGPARPLEDPSHDRRTLYGEVSRFQLDTYLQTFDFPNPSLTVEKRFTTNVPLQNLYFMNSDFVFRQAQGLATRLTGVLPPEGDEHDENGERGNRPSGAEDEEEEVVDTRLEAAELAAATALDDADRIRLAYELLFGREPERSEIERGLAFLATVEVAAIEAGSAEGATPTPDLVTHARWTRYAHALVNANELRFVN